MSSSLQASTANKTTVPITEMRSYIIGMSCAGFVTAFFGAFWWGMGASGIQNLFPGDTIVIIAIVAFMTILLISGAIIMIRATTRLPKDTSPAGKARQAAVGKHIGKSFGLISVLEVGFIAAGSILLSVFHHSEFLAPFIAFIVGVHFFPLAPLFRMRLYHLTGALLVLVSVAVVLLVPVNMLIGNYSAWNVLVGSLSACTLWLTGCYALLRGRNLLRQAQNQ